MYQDLKSCILAGFKPAIFCSVDEDTIATMPLCQGSVRFDTYRLLFITYVHVSEAKAFISLDVSISQTIHIMLLKALQCFPKNLTPKRNSNPGLLFVRQM
jgi:hypothetical protein